MIYKCIHCGKGFESSIDYDAINGIKFCKECNEECKKWIKEVENKVGFEIVQKK